MKVLQYSNNSLASALENQYTSAEVISSKNHFIYLTNYLSSSDMATKTIVIEEDHISKDFKTELKQHLILNQNIHKSLFQHIANTKYYQFLIDKL